MRFMIMVRANADSEADVMPSEPLIAQMTDYHKELAQAGALLDASGLEPSSKGWLIRYSRGKSTVVDGPYAEAKELIAGFTIIDVPSRTEALEWTKRFPNPFPEAREAVIEVRPLKSLDEFGESENVKRFRELGVRSQK